MRPERPGAFTLLEVMLATAITSLVLVAGFSFLGTIWRVQRAVESAPTIAEEAAAVMSQIDSDLRRVPRSVYPPGTDRFVAVEPSPHPRVDWTAEADAIDAETSRTVDLAEVGYRLDPIPTRPGWLRLLRRVDPTRDDLPLEGGTWTAVSDRVLGLSFRFHDPAAGDPDAGWSETWRSGTQGIPDLVEVTLALGDPPEPPGTPAPYAVFRAVVPTGR